MESILLATVVTLLIKCPQTYTVEYPLELNYMLVEKDGNFVEDLNVYKQILATVRKYNSPANLFSQSMRNSLYSLENVLSEEKDNLADFQEAYGVEIQALISTLEEALDKYREFLDAYDTEYSRYKEFIKAPYCRYKLDQNLFTKFDTVYYVLTKYYRAAEEKARDLEEEGLPKSVADYVKAPYHMEDLDSLANYVDELKDLSRDDYTLYQIIFERSKKEYIKKKYFLEKEKPIKVEDMEFPDINSAVSYLKMFGIDFSAEYENVLSAEMAGDYKMALVYLEQLREKVESVKIQKEESTGNPGTGFFFILLIAVVILIWYWRRRKEDEGGMDYYSDDYL